MPFLSNEEFNEVYEAVKTASDALSPANNSEEQQASDELLKAYQLMFKAKQSVASVELRQAAHEEYGSDEIEIDDEGAGASPGDGGTWVQAWVWVEEEEEDDDDEV